MKFAGTVLVTFLMVFIPSAGVFAHVILRDEAGSKGLVMHASPDDNPVAGEKTVLYFDLQDNGRQYEFALYVTDPGGDRQEVPVTAIGGVSASAEVVFPVRGAYKIELVATDTDSRQPAQFTAIQFVSRGAGGVLPDERRHAWAEIGIVAAAAGLAALLAVVFVRWRHIAAFSKKLG